jgi:hypothetical protein
MEVSKRVRILAAIVGSGIVVASSACGVDTTAPTPAPIAPTLERVSSFVPSEASKSLVGVADGVYTVTFNPAVDQRLALGPNRLEIPANGVCELATSGYGAEYWNQSCAPETNPVTLVITVKNASSSNPSIDFQPAMRFNPKTNVALYFYVPKVSKQDAKNWVITYCPTLSHYGRGGSKCVNEAQKDHDLDTYIDYKANVLFRRIKHFSAYQVDASANGYLVTE